MLISSRLVEERDSIPFPEAITSPEVFLIHIGLGLPIFEPITGKGDGIDWLRVII